MIGAWSEMSKTRLVMRLLPALAVLGVLSLSLLASPTQLPGSRLVASCGYGYGSGSGPAPAVTSVSPNFGGIGGGTSVTITGSGFCNNTASVQFGATPAASWVLVDDNHITAVSPAHAVGTVDVTVTNGNGTSPIVAADHFTFLPDSPSVYTAINPLRVLDTRNNGGTLGPDYVLRIGGISCPANATAAAINVAATNTTTAGALIVYPTGATQPNVANLNWTAGATVPNLVIVKLGTNGQITIHNIQGSVDVVVDLEGCFAPSTGGTAGEYTPVVPARITDTRPGSGQANAGSTLGSGATLDVQINGAGGLPLAGIAAVCLEVTVTNTSTSSALTAWPSLVARPLASNLNWVMGQTVPNRVIVAVGTNGKVSFYNWQGSTDIIVDVCGYFTDATAAGAVYFSLTPSRIVDTRNGTGGFSSPIAANSSIVVTVAGQGGVPLMSAADAPTAVVLNVAVTNTTACSALVVWPDLVAQPLSADQNWCAGVTRSNLVVVKVGTNGKIDLYNYVGSVDVIIDVEGYFH
jgi:hypothetical protein